MWPGREKKFLVSHMLKRSFWNLQGTKGGQKKKHKQNVLQVLAKLACGLNKPNRQTVLPLGSVSELFMTLPISKM